MKYLRIALLTVACCVWLLLILTEFVPKYRPQKGRGAEMHRGRACSLQLILMVIGILVSRNFPNLSTVVIGVECWTAFQLGTMVDLDKSYF